MTIGEPNIIERGNTLLSAVAEQLATVRDADYPAIVLCRLVRQSALQYRGLLHLASDWDTIGAGEVLVRSLLECHALIGWLTDDVRDPRGRSVRCRALCYELGLAHQAEGQVKGLMWVITKSRHS